MILFKRIKISIEFRYNREITLLLRYSMNFLNICLLLASSILVSCAIVFFVFKKVFGGTICIFAGIATTLYTFMYVDGHFYWILSCFATLCAISATGELPQVSKINFKSKKIEKRVIQSATWSLVLCLSVVLICFIVNYYKLNIDSIFFSISLWLIIIGSIGTFATANDYNNVVKAAFRLIENKKNVGFFTINDIFYQLYEQKQQTQKKFDEFLKEKVVLCEEILDDLITDQDIVLINLNSIKIYFFNSKYNELINKITEITTIEILTDKQKILTELDRVAPLGDEALLDLIILQDIDRRLYNDKEVFISPKNIDKVRYCSSCGKVVLLDSTSDDIGEWFCSKTCEQTEENCLNLAENIHNSSKFIEEQKIINNSVPVASVTIPSSDTWNTNFRPIQTGKEYLEYTKGVGTNAKGQVVDAKGNVINPTGHGDAAEIMNTKLDNISGKNAKLVGGDNAKNGADRIVDGIEIQSKYYKSAQASVDSSFDGSKGNYRYMRDDGKPMQLEVPKDQYDKAVEIMAKKIKAGKVPGVTDPNEARNIIRKGQVTLDEAKNYAKFCSKESLKFDAINGVVVAAGAFGISFVINTSIVFFREKDIKKALQQSSVASMRAGGQAFITYIASSQIQRIPQVNSFLQSAINFKFDSQIGKAFAGTVTKPGNISATTAANNALRSTVVVAGVTMAITSSIEIVQMMRGQISGMQCIKNIAQNAGGIAGGTAGALAGAAACSFIPGVGTIVGGVVGGVIGGFSGGALVKKFMDKFIEDDCVKKQRIFFLQMLYLAVIFKLSGNEAKEFKNKVDQVIMSAKDFFGGNFSANEMQPYSNSVLKPIVVSVVATRPILPSQTFKEEVIEAVIVDEVLQSA